METNKIITEVTKNSKYYKIVTRPLYPEYHIITMFGSVVSDKDDRLIGYYENKGDSIESQNEWVLNEIKNNDSRF